MSPTAPINPFANRAMLVDARDFFGRTREIETVLGRVLSGSKAQSLSLVGQRRIGKSSLFRRLLERVPEARPGTVASYLDLEASRKLSAGRFFSLVHGRLARAVAAGPVAPDAGDGAWDELLGFLEQQEGKHRFVLLLDEFDTVTANPAFDADFFGSLRYLANNFDLAFVTSSYEDLTDLCHAEEIRQSPFFNVFTTLDLGLMPDAEIEAMLAELAARSEIAIGLDGRLLARELGGHYPFFVQMAASAAWELVRETGRVAADAVRERFLAEASGHFRYFAGHLGAAERAALGDLARGGRPPEEQTRRLARRSLIEPAGRGEWRFFSPAFAAWVAETTSGAPGVGAVPATAATPVPGGRAPSGQETRVFPLDGQTVDPAREGSVLNERYELERRLGAGSFGTVWVALDRALGRRVALKLLQVEPGARDGAERRLRFAREGRVLARLQHPNVVTVFDAGTWQEQSWIAMELVEGGSLAEQLGRAGRLEPAAAARIVRDAALGLGHAHAMGIIHRDVKPANIVLGKDGRARVADFGIGIAVPGGDAGSLERVTGEGRALGTPCYMAPEQLLGEALDRRADLYALGVVLFECLTGRRPHDGVTVASMVARILTEPAPDPRELLPGLDGLLAAVVRRLLEREPGQRFASAEELVAALEPLL